MPDFPLSPLRLVVLISGGGTTLANLLKQIDAGELDAQVELVIASKSGVGGLKIAERHGIPSAVVDFRAYPDAESFSAEVWKHILPIDPHLVVMGGFLRRLLIRPEYRQRITNVHPGLIPAFCGKGFYGGRVHQAVLDYGAKISGCTIHFVDEEYDHGPIILQRVVPVLNDDTAETLAARVFEAECEAYPEALRLYAQGRLEFDGRRIRCR